MIADPGYHAARCVEFAGWKQQAFRALAPFPHQAEQVFWPPQVTEVDIQDAQEQHGSTFLDRCADELENAWAPNRRALLHQSPAERRQAYREFVAMCAQTGREFAMLDVLDETGIPYRTAFTRLARDIRAGILWRRKHNNPMGGGFYYIYRVETRP